MGLESNHEIEIKSGDSITALYIFWSSRRRNYVKTQHALQCNTSLRSQREPFVTFRSSFDVVACINQDIFPEAAATSQCTQVVDETGDAHCAAGEPWPNSYRQCTDYSFLLCRNLRQLHDKHRRVPIIERRLCLVRFAKSPSTCVLFFS